MDKILIIQFIRKDNNNKVVASSAVLCLTVSLEKEIVLLYSLKD